MTSASQPDWIAVDWGTSNVRVWAMRNNAAPRLLASSNQGMSRLRSDQYVAVLDSACSSIEAREGMTVIVCGMAGARQGWLEAPYLDAPLDLSRLASAAVCPSETPSGLRSIILPGVSQRGPLGDDVMRGEETQLFGYCALKPDFCGAVLLPGTHSKCALLERGFLRRFSTAMTGELFDAISHHTVLARTLEGEVPRSNEHLEQQELGQADGIAHAIEAPEQLTSLLFRVRASALLSGRDRYWAHGYLSGLLIGAEVCGKRDWFAGQASVPLIGSTKLVAGYVRALAMMGHVGTPIDATDATLRGLSACMEEIH